MGVEVTDQQIADGVLRATEDALKRVDDDMLPLWAQELRATYLSGASQAASFLIRGDGGVTAHQLMRGIQLAGKKLDLDFGPPET